MPVRVLGCVLLPFVGASIVRPIRGLLLVHLPSGFGREISLGVSPIRLSAYVVACALLVASVSFGGSTLHFGSRFAFRYDLILKLEPFDVRLTPFEGCRRLIGVVFG